MLAGYLIALGVAVYLIWLTVSMLLKDRKLRLEAEMSVDDFEMRFTKKRKLFELTVTYVFAFLFCETLLTAFAKKSGLTPELIIWLLFLLVTTLIVNSSIRTRYLFKGEEIHAQRLMGDGQNYPRQVVTYAEIVNTTIYLYSANGRIISLRQQMIGYVWLKKWLEEKQVPVKRRA